MQIWCQGYYFLNQADSSTDLICCSLIFAFVVQIGDIFSIQYLLYVTSQPALENFMTSTNEAAVGVKRRNNEDQNHCMKSWHLLWHLFCDTPSVHHELSWRDALLKQIPK